MRKPRRTQSERSIETKEKLLKATVELLFEQGNVRLTTALVDERAGVSSGARVHHYPSKIDLVVAATSHAYDRAAQLGRQRAEAAKTSADPLRDYVKDCLSVYFDWPFIAALEVVITARTDGALMERIRPVLEGFHRGMKATWVETLVATGYEARVAEEELALTISLIRGMAVNRIWMNDDKAYLAMLDTWCADRAARRRTLATSTIDTPANPVRPRDPAFIR